MDLAYKYELKLKKKNAPKDQQTQNYKSGLKSRNQNYQQNQHYMDLMTN